MQLHDTVALPAVLSAWESAGFEAHACGQEADTEALRSALCAQSDATSRMLRFRPDRVLVKRGVRSVLCEVKSETKGYSNYAVEVDSYLAARQWNAAYSHVCYAFVTLTRCKDGGTWRVGEVVGCWANEIPEPSRITVPRRWDAAKTLARLGNEMPGVNLVPSEWRGGSGTAFFTIPKSSRFLVPLRIFADALSERRVIIGRPVGVTFPRETRAQHARPAA